MSFIQFKRNLLSVARLVPSFHLSAVSTELCPSRTARCLLIALAHVSPALRAVFWTDVWSCGSWKLWRPYIHYWPGANKCSARRLLLVWVQQVLYWRCIGTTIHILQARKVKHGTCELLKHLLAGHSCSVWLAVSRVCYLTSTRFLVIIIV